MDGYVNDSLHIQKETTIEHIVWGNVLTDKHSVNSQQSYQSSDTLCFELSRCDIFQSRCD